MSHHCTVLAGAMSCRGVSSAQTCYRRYRLTSSPGMEKHSDRTTCDELSLSVIFLWLSVKAVYGKGKNLRDSPRLSQEAQGYFTVRYGSFHQWGTHSLKGVYIGAYMGEYSRAY